MRKIHRYNIISGIVLILSVIYFALAAPVLVQEKRQASVDVVHMPKDMRIVLGKRMDEDPNEFSRLMEEHFKMFRKPVESSSSAPPQPDHGSTNVVQAPVPDQALSDAHASSNSAPPGPDHGSKNVVQDPPPNPASSAANPSPLMEPSESSPSSSASSETSLSDHPEDLEWMVELDEMLGAYPHQPNPKKRPWTDLDSDPDSDFNRNYWMNFVNRLPPRPGSRPANGWTEVSQPLPSIPEEPSPVSSPVHALPSPGDGSGKLWLKPFGNPESHFLAKPDSELSDAHASSSSARPRPDHGSTNVAQESASNPASSAANPSPLMEPSSPSSSASSETSLSDNPEDLEWMVELDELLGEDSDFNSNYRMNSVDRLPPRPGSRPANGWTEVSQPLPSIPEEPSPVSSPDHALPSPGDGSNELWLKPFGYPESHFFAKPESSSAARPSSSSPPSGPADGSTDVEQPLLSTPEESSSLSSPDHAPPNPRSLTESGYELMKEDAPPRPSSPESSTNPDPQSMGKDSTRKTEENRKSLGIATRE